MADYSENQFSKYFLGNYVCKCQTFINTYTIVWYRLSNLFKYKPNIPYNSQGQNKKNILFPVKGPGENNRHTDPAAKKNLFFFGCHIFQYL